ncbi:hypothetical protein [Agaribacter marinus]|uniref:SGNH hydrolase-type esterase domain-containing protein n=1 Tax=Agaribacter marinus TaxID=1431249 RepID=A0AA37SZK4_9ALTE|nr:hypothetical protein [Agaribacter marinus]GLR70920.1 hypothetical protein GCM10007852_18280 [Agaribacter marinus]
MIRIFISAAALLLIVVSVAILNLERNTKLLIQYYWEDYLSLDAGATIFVGSSTIARLTQSALGHCEPLRIRGFENGHTSDVLRYLKTLPLDKVKSLVLYVGENDIAHGLSYVDALKELEYVLSYLESAKSDVTAEKVSIALLTIKNSPQRPIYHHQFEQFNVELEKIQHKYTNLHLIPLASLKASTYFLSDGIHLNSPGYGVLNNWINEFCHVKYQAKQQ